MTTEADLADLESTPPPDFALQPASREEPVALAEALSAAFGGHETVGAYVGRMEAQDRAKPGEYYPLGVCRHCGTSLGASEDDKVIPVGSFGYLPNVCCQSCSAAGKTRIAADDAKERARRFASFVPAEFVWWDRSKGNNDALAAALGKFAPDARRGMLIYGGTGTGKTRIMWELVKTLSERPDPPSWAWLDSFDAATTGIPADAARADFLFIDDLGNEPTSTKFETSLLRLIRKRSDWHRPTFITTQLTGEQFKGRFFHGPAGAAILRRLTERSDKIPTA